MQKKYFERPAIFLLPFLLLYIAIVLFAMPAGLVGDEGRYLQFAHNLLDGFYSPPPPEINLWNGPGYPLYLALFLALHIPLLLVRLCNAILYYATLLLIRKTLRAFANPKKSFFITALAGLYYMPWKSLPYLLSETFTMFLIACIVFFSAEVLFKNKSGKFSFRDAIFILLLAFLALTKVIFGTVYLFAAIIFLAAWIISKRVYFRKFSLLLLAALTCCIPYLNYTHALTGKWWYWSNAGGMSLYWMSNPFENERGEWHDDSLHVRDVSPESEKVFQSVHMDEYAHIYSYAGVARDDQFRKIAEKNIAEHPQKYIMNWLANCSRLLFNYPVSYRGVTGGTLWNMLANIPVLVLLLIAAIRQRKISVPPFLQFLLVLSVIYLFITSLLSAYDRMFYILMPVIGTWLAWVYASREKSGNGNQVVSSVR